MLDVGCGWGSLSLHAAEHFGAQVTGVTIAAEQKRFIDARIAERGLADRVEIGLQDYRDGPEPAASTPSARSRWASTSASGNYPTYVDVLRRSVRPGGRGAGAADVAPGRNGGGTRRRAVHRVLHRPDMHMRPSGRPSPSSRHGGLEVRDVHALREHYVRTVAGWLENFEANVDELDRARRRGGRPRLAALPRRRRDGVPRRPDGRRPDPLRRGRAAPHRLPARAPLVIARGSAVPGARLSGCRWRWRSPPLVARRLGRVSVVDVTWGLALVAVACVARLAGTTPGAAWLLAAVVAVWGVRLAWHIVQRSQGPRRGPAVRGDARRPVRRRLRARRAQGLRGPGRRSLAGRPAADGGRASSSPVRVAGRGWAPSLWVAGMVFEAVGDAQLAAYTRPPRDRGTGAGHRAVGLDAAPELLRRRLRVVGHLARRRTRVGLAARAAHRRWRRSR